MPRVFIYSIALSQGSRLHSCVHTPPPPPLLMLLQTLLVRKQPENQQGPASAFWRWLLECTSKDSFLLLLSFCFILIPGRTVLNFHSFVLFHFCLEHEKDTCTGPALAGELLLLLLRRHLNSSCCCAALSQKTPGYRGYKITTPNFLN